MCSALCLSWVKRSASGLPSAPMKYNRSQCEWNPLRKVCQSELSRLLLNIDREIHARYSSLKGAVAREMRFQFALCPCHLTHLFWHACEVHSTKLFFKSMLGQEKCMLLEASHS